MVDDLSLVLLFIFEHYAINEKLLGIAALSFFCLLSIRFGFWFYSRVLRAANAAGQQQRIAWVECGYYSGMIFGLIIWTFLGINIGITMALLIDAVLQFGAGFIDFCASKISNKQFQKNQNNDRQIAMQETMERKRIVYWNWRLAEAIVFLTIGIQVNIFDLAHQVSDYFSPYVLAIFYFGVSIAAIVYKKCKIRLEWDSLKGYAMINTNNGCFRFLTIGILATICVGIAILDAHYFFSNTFKFGKSLLPLIVCAGAFFYEILALAIIDRLGLEQSSNQRGMIIRTYGLMGIGAVISLWILGITNSTLFGLLFMLTICLSFTILAMGKRENEAVQ